MEQEVAGVLSAAQQMLHCCSIHLVVASPLLLELCWGVRRGPLQLPHDQWMALLAFWSSSSCHSTWDFSPCSTGISHPDFDHGLVWPPPACFQIPQPQNCLLHLPFLIHLAQKNLRGTTDSKGAFSSTCMVLKVMRKEEASSSGTCQNPCSASRTVNTLAPWRRVAISLMVSRGQCSHWIAMFKSFRWGIYRFFCLSLAQPPSSWPMQWALSPDPALSAVPGHASCKQSLSATSTFCGDQSECDILPQVDPLHLWIHSGIS